MVHNTRRGTQMLCSGADDRTIRLRDKCNKLSVNTLEASYQNIPFSLQNRDCITGVVTVFTALVSVHLS
uniref:Uncharacterized protein n=1 Tax=Glossina morsitans morsitans TaxID=37546 RepID=A0A1B0F960_GLOMM